MFLTKYYKKFIENEQMIRDIHLILFNIGQSDIDRVGCSIEM